MLVSPARACLRVGVALDALVVVLGKAAQDFLALQGPWTAGGACSALLLLREAMGIGSVWRPSGMPICHQLRPGGAPVRSAELLRRDRVGGRSRIRTCDILGVSEALYH